MDACGLLSKFQRRWIPMNCNRRLVIGVFALVTSVFQTGCHNSSDDPSAPTAACTTATQGASSSLITTSATNVIPVYIADTATTGQVIYNNEPLVSVKICSPNHTSEAQCQVISNILLDTGSYGLRVFASAMASNVV